MIDDISLFVHIVQAGGLAAAGQRLGLPPATVTRRLQRLEDQLGTQLIHRSSRRCQMTPLGEAYYRALGPLVTQIEGTLQDLADDTQRLSGPITLAMPSNIALSQLRDIWGAFCLDYPDVQLNLRLSNRMTDLTDEGVDLALRIGSMPDSDFRQRRIGVTRQTVLASPSYLERAGVPEDPGALAHHRIVGASPLPRWQLRHRTSGVEQVLELGAVSASDDLAIVAQLARDGVGLVLLPVSESAEDVAAGRLVPVLRDWWGPDRPLHLVWPVSQRPVARVRCLGTYLADRIGSMPALQGALPWEG